MKKSLAIVLTLVMLISIVPLGAVTANAKVSSGTTGDCTWSLDGTVLTISGYGEIENFYFKTQPWGRDITEVIIKHGVTRIGIDAFYMCESLKRITIPDSITSIGDGAFEKTAYYNDENNWENGVLYIGNHLIKAKNSISGKYIIRNGILTIAGEAFENCSAVTDIIIPDSVVTIGAAAFNHCSSLFSISIGTGVKEIYDAAFDGCNNLSEVHIFDLSAWCKIRFNYTLDLNKYSFDTNPLSNGSDLFFNEMKVTQLEIPDGVTEIYYGAFLGCRSIKSVRIPDSVISIGQQAFAYCYNLAEFVVDTDNIYYSNDENGVLFNKDKSYLICFPNGYNVTKYTVPDTVEVVVGFEGCTNLVEVILPSDVVIGQFAFCNCKSLNSINISNAIDFINSGAFLGCVSLTDVKFGNKVKGIYDYAFRGCSNLMSITIPGNIKTIYDRTIEKGVVIYGNMDTAAQEYASRNGNPFYPIDTHTDYYANVGSYGFVIRDKNGMALSGCTITIDGKNHITGVDTSYIDIPSDYIGNVTISKKGYITSTLPAEQLKSFNFFVLYPETEENPIVQHLMLRETGKNSESYSDLLISDEYIYDLGNKHHDLYIQVNPNGNTVSNIYLKQGNTKVELKNGLNNDINTNGLFNSDKGVIYLCIGTSDGKIYQMDSNIVALKKALKLDAGIDGEISSVVEEEMEAIGGWELKGKFKLGDLPVSLEIGEDYSVKGTIGVKGNDADVATWYETISSTIKSHEENGKTQYDSETVEELVKGLEEKGAYIDDGYCSFGIDVEGSIIGYVEGKWNPELAKLEDVKVGAIFKISGEMSYVQQSAIMVAAVPVPYYWTVDFGLELSSKIGANLEYTKEDNLDLEVSFPEISFAIEVGGSLCLGADKIIGGGGKVKGNVKITFVEPNYDFTSCTVTAKLEFGLTGQLAGFSGDFTIWNGEHELYSSASKSNLSLNSVNLMAKYATNSVLLASDGYESAVYSTNQSDNSSFTFKSNGYTYAAPVTARLSNGNAVMVWVDYDEDRLDINKTALYYSVYDAKTHVWSTPAQVNDDGTADDLPVLKTINNKIHLVWNDADKVLDSTNTFNDMLANMGISYAVFDGEKFTSITSVSGKNSYMDICADITVVNSVPYVAWLANENNDLFGQNGKNKLMCATYQDSAWSASCVFESPNMINSLAIVEENNGFAVYCSASNSSDYNANSFEIFKITDGDCEQITTNDYADTSITSYDNVIYWKSPNKIQSCNGNIECPGVSDKYIVVKDINGYRSIIFTTNETTYKISRETSEGFSVPFDLYSGDYISGGFTAYYDTEKLTFITNETDINGTSSVIKIHSFGNESNLRIIKAYYDKYTLMKGCDLRATLLVENVGIEKAQGYTIYAYSNGDLLASQRVNSSLLPGDELDIKMLIRMPNDVEVETIDFYIVLDNDQVDFNIVDYSMPLSLVDVSVENAIIVTDKKVSKLNATIVNRGMADISKVVVKLKDDEQGEVLSSVEISNINSRAAKTLSFDISSFVENTKYYVTIDALEGETLVGNNSDFTYVNTMKVNELTPFKCDSTHTYDNNCDKACNICGDTRTITHNYAAATCTKAKTCKVCSVTSGKALGHTYTNSCDKTCNHCKSTRSIKHTYSNSCDTSCNVCKAIRKITHAYKTTTTKATLTKNGSVNKKCAICGKVASKTTIKYAKTFKLSTTTYTYNGKVKTPSVTVKDSAGKVLKKNTDYTVTYASGRKNVGTYKVTIKMKGKYSGTKTLTFKINPPKTTVSKLTAGKKSIKVTISKKSTQVMGYQIEYSTSKKFKSAKTKTISNYKTTKYTIKSLKAKKTYYVRIRTYKTVNGKKYYSSWSSYKSMKTK